VAPDFVEVLDFWSARRFAERGQARKSVVQKSEPFDAEIRRRFLVTWERTARGELGSWQTTPLASLALVVTSTSFPRNMFRGTARAFASDSLALRRGEENDGRGGLTACFHRSSARLSICPSRMRRISPRNAALSPVQGLDPEHVEAARRHYEIVARSGAFRTAMPLSAANPPPEEIEFLRQPGSSF